MNIDGTCAKTVSEILVMERRLHPDSTLGCFSGHVRWLCEQIILRGFRLQYRYDQNAAELYSSVDFTAKVVWWHIEATSGSTLLWDLIHEFGHILLGRANAEVRRSHCWEFEAWKRGWAETSKEFPELTVHYQRFQLRQDECLLSYYKNGHCLPHSSGTGRLII